MTRVIALPYVTILDHTGVKYRSSICIQLSICAISMHLAKQLPDYLSG
jgi:hypothetical protein